MTFLRAAVVDLDRFPVGSPAGATPETPRRVWYFGDRFDRWERLRAASPPGWVAEPSGERLTDAARRTADDLIDLDRQLLRHERLRPIWDVSQLSDRGPYASPAQILIARTLVFLELLAGGGDHLFVTDDERFGRALIAVARRNGFEATWLGEGRAPFAGLRRLRDVALTRYSAIRDALARLRMARERRKTSPVPLDALRACDALIVTWVGSATFPQGVVCETNPFFGRLPALLRASGRRVGFIALPLYWTEYYGGILANVVRAGDPALIFEDAVGVADLLRSAVTAALLPLAVRRRLRCAGFDMSPLVAEMLAADASYAAPLLADAHAAVGRFLARAGIRPEVIHHVHENQPWERRLRAGLRRYLPETRIEAIQASFVGELFLGLSPSRSEIAAGRLPDRLLVPGDHFRDFFLRRGFPADRIAVVGALRYERLAAAPIPAAAARTVLCATSIDVGESLELLLKTVQAVSGLEDSRLLVNFHPSLEKPARAAIMRRLADRVGRSADLVEEVEGPAAESLPRAAVLVYNTSGAAMDALAMGRRAIYVGRDCMIDHDKTPAGAADACRSAEELRALLARAFAEPAPPDRNKASDAWAAPVDPTLGRADPRTRSSVGVELTEK